MLSLNGQNRSVLVADFETTTDPLDCRVWAWACVNLWNPDMPVIVDRDIESFARYVARDTRIVYFHNLAFDGSFIIDFLFRQGFAYTKDRRLTRGQFATLISHEGKFYSITVRWRNGKTTEFRDSLKKLPMSVKKIAEAFSLDISKGEIDYDLPRPKGWKITPQERDYIERDVRIVAKALNLQINEGMVKLTVGADSLAQFRDIITPKTFDRLFPILPETMDNEIRKAYRGGFTYADERFRGKLVGTGRVYDVNSLYPSVMYDRVLPYGEPIFRDGLPEISDEYPLMILSLTFTAQLKPGHIPCIQIKGSSFFNGAEYLTTIDDPVTLFCTNVDLDLWKEQYDLDILSYNGGWLFHGISGVFCEYIDKWMAVKASSDGGLRTIAKLHLNSLYGKFATNPDVTGKIPIMENDAVRLVGGPKETRPPVYTAMGVFITAYARDVTIRAAQKHYPMFLYADTDSLHMLDGDHSDLDIHPSRLGAWKHEYSFDGALFLRAKAYTEHIPNSRRRVTRRWVDWSDMPLYGRFETHIAGLPDVVAHHVRFDDSRSGRVLLGKLVPKRVPSGIVLHDVGFTLKI